MVRSGLRKVFETQAGWQVVAEAVDGKDAIFKALQTKPDVAILDYSLPLINGVEATRQIRARLPKTEVLIFTMHDLDSLIGEILAAGARGYLLKSDANAALLAAVEALAAHKPYFTPNLSEALLEFLSGAPWATAIFSNTARARGSAARCRRALQQAGGQRPEYRYQDGGDTSRGCYEETQYVLNCLPGALCDPQQARRTLRKRADNGAQANRAQCDPICFPHSPSVSIEP